MMIVGVPMMPAIHAARNRVAGKTTQHRSTRDAADISVRYRAADHTTADRTDDRAGRMTMTAALIGKDRGR